MPFPFLTITSKWQYCDLFREMIYLLCSNLFNEESNKVDHLFKVVIYLLCSDLFTEESNI